VGVAPVGVPVAVGAVSHGLRDVWTGSLLLMFIGLATLRRYDGNRSEHDEAYGERHMSSRTTPVIVLLVQPERDDRDMYAEFLRYHGVMPLAVSSAPEALTVATRADVIVTALLLPGEMEGVEFITRLKNDERTKHIPVIVLTACAWESDHDRAAAAGCDAFLTKPCLPDALFTEIRRALTLRRVPKPEPASAELLPSARFRRPS